MDRSPSHESMTTDLSLLSLSSLNSDKTKLSSQWSHSTIRSRLITEELDSSPSIVLSVRRSPTPQEEHGMQRAAPSSRGALLQIPGEHRGRSSISPRSSTVKTINQIIFEEESDVIKSCGALLSAVGLSKSFSTGDVCMLVQGEEETSRKAISECALNDWSPKFDLSQFGFSTVRPLDCASRSCSTWVAVGDAVSSTSQLPSPQAQLGSLNDNACFSAVDFVRSVNKKVRQNYIRGRVMSTYRVLQRLTGSISPSSSKNNIVSDKSASTVATTATAASSSTKSKEKLTNILNDAPDLLSSLYLKNNKLKPVSLKDVEKDKGKPLTKYDRNIMIFNWLQNLEESNFDEANFDKFS